MLKRECVYNEISELIRSGEWAPGYKIPAEPLLCRRLGVAGSALPGDSAEGARRGLERFVRNGCGAPELSARPPDPGNGGFGDGEAFGEVLFERRVRGTGGRCG